MATSFPPPLPFQLPDPLRLLPAAINHLLKAEPWAREQLRPHAGKTLHFVMAPFELRLAVTDDGYVSLAPRDADAAVRIDLPLTVLPQVLTQGQAAVMRQTRIDGDADFAHVVSTVAQNLRWDAEEDLSKLVGDVAARRLTGGVRAAVAQARTANTKLAGNIAEYLVEENPQLIRPRDVDEFASAVRTLRDDLARLEKRLDRLA